MNDIEAKFNVLSGETIANVSSNRYAQIWKTEYTTNKLSITIKNNYGIFEVVVYHILCIALV